MFPQKNFFMFISPWECGLAHLAKIPVALAEILASGPASASTLYKHNKNFKRVQGPGGALGYFSGGYVPPGTPNWHPFLEKISPKIDTPF